MFYLQIGLGEDKNLVDFGLTRFKVKVTKVIFVKQVNNVFRSIS